jgi:hypothetical protein
VNIQRCSATSRQVVRPRLHISASRQSQFNVNNSNPHLSCSASASATPIPTLSISSPVFATEMSIYGRRPAHQRAGRRRSSIVVAAYVCVPRWLSPPSLYIFRAIFLQIVQSALALAHLASSVLTRVGPSISYYQYSKEAKAKQNLGYYDYYYININIYIYQHTPTHTHAAHLPNAPNKSLIIKIIIIAPNYKIYIISIVKSYGQYSTKHKARARARRPISAYKQNS